MMDYLNWINLKWLLVVLGLLLVVVAAYAIYARRKTGVQPGEELIARLLGQAEKQAAFIEQQAKDQSIQSLAFARQMTQRPLPATPATTQLVKVDAIVAIPAKTLSPPAAMPRHQPTTERMTMTKQQDIDAINTAATEADAKLGQMDALLGQAAERNGVGDHAAGGAAMLKAHLLLGGASMKLASVARMAVTALARATDDTVKKPTDDPNIVTWTRTDGSTARVPRAKPEAGEGIMGYAQRVSAETGYPAGAVGALGSGIASTAADALKVPNTPENWPKIIDYLAAPRRYMTPEQLAADDAQIEASNANTQYNGSIDPYSLTCENWSYYAAHNLMHLADKIFAGKRSDVNAAIGKCGDSVTSLPQVAGPLEAFG